MICAGRGIAPAAEAAVSGSVLIGTSGTRALPGGKLGRIKRDVSSGARGCVGPQRLKPLLLRSPQLARVELVPFPVRQGHESDLWPFRFGSVMELVAFPVGGWAA